MKVAIMQPYVFPYIGYFQLIKVVDVFVFYDDVNFIKQGWVNRNKILVSGKEFVFTIPLKDASSFVTIRETQINESLYIKWKDKFLRTLEQSYKKAPYFEKVFALITEILMKNNGSISELAIESIIKISAYLDLRTLFEYSSVKYEDTKGLDRESRLVEIIKRKNAANYINPIGGQQLYNKISFAKQGIQLSFISSKVVDYKQFGNEFVPWLSIIDIMMFNNPKEINILLDKFELV